MLRPGSSTERLVTVSVTDDQKAQGEDVPFRVVLNPVPANASSLSFIIPPNDLMVVLREFAFEPAEDGADVSTIRAAFAADGLRSGKSFVVFSDDRRLAGQDGIIAARQGSFSAVLSLNPPVPMKDAEALDLSISHLDALNPSARMSAQISAWSEHTCSITPGSRAKCWGFNNHGQTNAPTGEAFLAVSAGSVHSCGLTIQNRMRCWGHEGAFPSFGIPPDFRVSGPNNDPGYFLAVSAASISTCGIRINGRIECWGNGSPLVANNEPKGDNDFFLAVDAGNGFACAITVGSKMKCWGANNHGQANAPTDEAFLAVSAGNTHACALRTNGTLRCWGRDANGPAPCKIGDTDALCREKFLAVSTGNAHICGIRPDSTLRCGGHDAGGQAPCKIGETDALCSEKFLAVSASGGSNHTCGITADGDPECWGSDFIEGTTSITNKTKPESAGFRRARISPDVPPWLAEKQQVIGRAFAPSIKLRIRVYLEGALR